MINVIKPFQNTSSVTNIADMRERKKVEANRVLMSKGDRYGAWTDERCLSFAQVLIGRYHGRITVPEDKKARANADTLDNLKALLFSMCATKDSTKIDEAEALAIAEAFREKTIRSTPK